MRRESLGKMMAAEALATWVVQPAVAPTASAQVCPDVQMIFARGTGEPPGLGPTGQAFVDALRPALTHDSVDVCADDYPATNQWATGVDGVRDAGAQSVSLADSCPKTKMVLGGYSQGAAVAGFVTSVNVPAGIDPTTVPEPLQPEVADHVAAVVLFGSPNVRAMSFLGQPPVGIGPLYKAKTIELCAIGDPVCSDGFDFAAHNPNTYDSDLTNQGAAFAADRLLGEVA
jgi:hypothetical protein